MNHLEQERKKAWEELSFWRDFAVWWRAERGNSPEPRILEALDNAQKRYERSLEITGTLIRQKERTS